MITKFTIGLLMSTIIALLAYKKKSLSQSGGLAAILLGTSLYTIGHPSVYILMIIFFITGSVLSKIHKKISSKSQNNSDKILKETGCRNYIQVFANGGLPLICSLLYLIYPVDGFIIASAAAFAGTTADTWASEIGSLSTEKPKYLLNKSQVDPGLSGGVTKLGFLASLLGAGLIGISFVAIMFLDRGFEMKYAYYGIIVIAFGFLGSIVDSILGEKYQVKYYSNKYNGILTEKSNENGKINKIATGNPIMDNNMVNFLSILIITVLAYTFTMYII